MQNNSGSWLRNLLFLFVLIQLLPGVIKVAKNYYDSVTVPKTKIGMVTIDGEITNSSRTVYEIKALLEDSSIHGLILKIDSPGGAPGASQTLYHAIHELGERHSKPIVAWVENVGASGAYYAACAADYIIAAPSALVGSVGVYMTQPELKAFIEQFKIGYKVIKSGEYKAAGNMFIDQTPKQMEMFQQLSNDIHERFVKDVLAGRPQLAEVPRAKWAEGQPILGDRALELGLIDEVGSQLTVEAKIKELAEITTEIEIIKPSKAPAWAKLFGGDDGDDEHPYIHALVNSFCDRLGLAKASASHANFQA